MSFSRCFTVSFVALLIVGLANGLDARTFEMKDGTQVDGEVLSFKNGTILIAKDGGGKGLFTLAAFSEADQAYLNEAFPQGAEREERRGTTTKPKPAPPAVQPTRPTQPNTQQQRPAQQQPPHPGLKNLRIGSVPPELKARIQGTAQFASLNDKELRGKIIVVHFWSTSVPQSMKELEGLAYLHRKYHDRGFELIGVAMDQSQRRVNAVEEQLGVSWPMRLDEERQTLEQWGVTALPTNVLIDQVGVIRAPHISAHDLQHVLAKQLGEPK